jgi:hypothetical protein
MSLVSVVSLGTLNIYCTKLHLLALRVSCVGKESTCVAIGSYAGNSLTTENHHGIPLSDRSTRPPC